MKERLLDVMKWGLILMIAGAVFYIVCPKYYFKLPHRCNQITGQVEQWDRTARIWKTVNKHIGEKSKKD
jgi:hypothetical protein